MAASCFRLRELRMLKSGDAIERIELSDVETALSNAIARSASIGAHWYLNPHALGGTSGIRCMPWPLFQAIKLSDRPCAGGHYIAARYLHSITTISNLPSRRIMPPSWMVLFIAFSFGHHVDWPTLRICANTPTFRIRGCVGSVARFRLIRFYLLADFDTCEGD